MGILNNILPRQSAGKQKFVRVLSTADWLTANKTIVAAVWNEFGSYTVPAQQEITFGSNDPVGGASIAGRSTYIRIDSGVAGGTQLQGKIRFVLTNANQTNSVVVLEENTRKFSADQNDRTKAVLIPEYPLKAKEDSLLKLQFYPESGSTGTLDFDGTNTLLLIPVTVYQ